MPAMSRFNRLLPIIPILVVALLAGCGRKGPLYMPPPPPVDPTAREQTSANVPTDAESGKKPPATQSEP